MIKDDLITSFTEVPVRRTSGWERFQIWATAGDHPALPTTPQAMALYLGHLAATGRSMASIKQARAVVSHFHAAAGMRKADNPRPPPGGGRGRQRGPRVFPFPRRGCVE